MNKIEFTDKNGTFRIHNPENYSGLYLPLAGETGLKSSITPNLGGDSKTDQNHFLLEPVSIENLHNNRNTRNFWCRIENKGSWSVCGSSAKQEAAKFTKDQDESILEAGFMWQKLTRISREYEMKAETTSFVTIDGTMEVMMTELTNTADQEQKITPVAVIPLYGRSADNIRDHRHVLQKCVKLSLHNKTEMQQTLTLHLFQVLNSHSSLHRVRLACCAFLDGSWKNQSHVSNVHKPFLHLYLQMELPHP